MPNRTFSPLRWGILGPGNIANRFCNDVKALPDHQLAAVGSRDQAKADAFADKFGVINRHNSYEALVSDPTVDVVYVATPHNFHKEHALLALRAGKAVLVEKPFTINAREAEEVVKEARQRGLFLMEGMWTRFFPAMAKLRELVQAKAIGETQMLYADFGFRAGFNPKSRAFDPALGGGGLMDVGIYPVSLSAMLFGTPNRTSAMANLGETKVDEEAAMLLGHAGGQIAVLSTGVRVNTPQEATLVGTDGKIHLSAPWWRPSKLTVLANGKEPEVFEFPRTGEGFQYEAQHVAECLRAGKTESDILPLDETVSIMRTLDTLRAQMGVKYPMD